MAEVLILALLRLAPHYLDDARAEYHVEAAMAAAEAYDFPVELILAQAYIESRYQPTTLSRMQCRGSSCERKAGQWLYREPPPGARPSYYCGVMQVGGWIPWEDCVALMEDVPANYMEGAAELRRWTKSKLCQPYKGEERLRCALRGYGGGNAATSNLEMKYPSNVLNTAARLRTLVESETARAAQELEVARVGDEPTLL